MASKILSSKQAGGSYWDVQFQDIKTGTIFQGYLHESEYKLRVFEEKNIGSEITRGFLDEYKDLVHDVEYHNQCMEDCD